MAVTLVFQQHLSSLMWDLAGSETDHKYQVNAHDDEPICEDRVPYFAHAHHLNLRTLQQLDSGTRLLPEHVLVVQHWKHVTLLCQCQLTDSQLNGNVVAHQHGAASFTIATCYEAYE